MDLDLLKTVGQIAGIGGLALGVLLLVFRQILAKNIFPMLRKDDAYRLLRLMAILVFVVALAGLGAWVLVETRVLDGGSRVEATDGSVAVGGSVENSTITIQGHGQEHDP